MTSYLDLLTTQGLPAIEHGAWATAGHSRRDYGWKIHLSSIQLEAPSLIGRIGPLLRDRGIALKLILNAELLGELNAGSFGTTQVGKFATLYPRSDAEALSLATEIVALTTGFSGPRIATDRPLGGIVYTRFGPFNPRYERDRLGHRRATSPLPGAEYSIPYRPPEDVADPFAHWAAPAEPTSASRTIGPGFLPTDVLSMHAKGAVSLALDLRPSEEPVLAVLKEGRRYCMSDAQGRHMWDRLRHQQELGAALADRVRTPRPRDLFEHGDSLFLALDHIEGRDLAERVARPFSELDAAERSAIVADLIALVETLGALHATGVVHRDLSPSNIRIDGAGHAWLLDLEMAHLAGEHARLFAQGTAGFISPEQQAGGAAAFADDLYALGCLIVFLLTGFDARRIALDDDSGLQHKLAALSGGSHPLIDLCVGLLRKDPVKRLPLAQVASSLARIHARQQAPAPAQIDSNGLSAELLYQSSLWLTRGGLRDRATGLPLSPELSVHNGLSSIPGTRTYKLYRSTSRGVAGVLYAVARLARVGAANPDAADFASRASDWLLNHHPSDDDQLPGLHFGEAGVALALLEAVRSGLIDHGRWLRPYLLQCFAGDIDWPDLSHGAAGQGLAALQAEHLAGVPELGQFAQRCAHHLIETQAEDGGWRWPKGVTEMEGTAYTGFAHGTAGIVYFLALHARRNQSHESAMAARRGGEWLAAQRRPSDDTRFEWWPHQKDGEEAMHWWCHGGPGIAISMLALFELTGEEHWAAFARSALRAHPLHVRHIDLGQCHGLAGLGEIQLQAWRVLGEPEWLDRARAIGATLTALRRTRDGMTCWAAEDVHPATADLMIGSGGVIHFLARLYSDDRGRLGMPLSIDPDLAMRGATQTLLNPEIPSGRVPCP